MFGEVDAGLGCGRKVAAMTVSPAGVLPGDVLLFHGDSFVSWAIRKIDGSKVNHAAVALPGGQLAEAGGSGLETRAIPSSTSDRDYLLVRRHLTTAPLGPVVARANAYLAQGPFYAYQQIVLLAVLGLTRRIPARGLARRMLRSALDHAAQAVMDLLPVGKTWMICSEFVYRCFDEAVDASPDPFTIEIAGATYGGPAFGEESWLDWAQSNATALAITPSATFAAPWDPEAAEFELAPLIAEWATFAGIDEADPLPLAASFDVPTPQAGAPDPDVAAAAQVEEISDEEIQAAMINFSEALKVARASQAGIPVEFGLVPGAVTAAAVHGALQGLRELTVDANFVTPRDLLVSNSLGPQARVQ